MPTIAPVIVPDIAAPSMAVATTPAKESATIAPSAPMQTAITAPSQPKTISSVEYLQAPQPEYPSMSRRMGEQGKVILRILVNEKGRAEHIDIQRSSGFPRLDDAARAAASRALFKPYVEDGKAMAVYVVVPIGFQLD
jgi:periplasmic protein TonB